MAVPGGHGGSTQPLTCRTDPFSQTDATDFTPSVNLPTETTQELETTLAALQKALAACEAQLAGTAASPGPGPLPPGSPSASLISSFSSDTARISAHSPLTLPSQPSSTEHPSVVSVSPVSPGSRLDASTRKRILDQRADARKRRKAKEADVKARETAAAVAAAAKQHAREERRRQIFREPERIRLGRPPDRSSRLYVRLCDQSIGWQIAEAGLSELFGRFGLVHTVRQYPSGARDGVMVTDYALVTYYSRNAARYAIERLHRHHRTQPHGALLSVQFSRPNAAAHPDDTGVPPAPGASTNTASPTDHSDEAGPTSSANTRTGGRSDEAGPDKTLSASVSTSDEGSRASGLDRGPPSLSVNRSMLLCLYYLGFNAVNITVTVAPHRTDDDDGWSCHVEACFRPESGRGTLVMAGIGVVADDDPELSKLHTTVAEVPRRGRLGKIAYGRALKDIFEKVDLYVVLGPDGTPNNRAVFAERLGDPADMVADPDDMFASGVDPLTLVGRGGGLHGGTPFVPTYDNRGDDDEDSMDELDAAVLAVLADSHDV
eukprot:m.467128 g.467128  ORF g.467128 m.467128 type:complete len:547 (+) comp25946_c0_seq1:179-1819(+)